MESIYVSKRIKKRVRQLKRQLNLHSDDPVIELLLNHYRNVDTKISELESAIDALETSIKELRELANKYKELI